MVAVLYPKDSKSQYEEIGYDSEDVSEQRLTVRVPERLVKEFIRHGNGCRCGGSTHHAQRPLKSLLTLGTRLYFDLFHHFDS